MVVRVVFVTLSICRTRASTGAQLGTEFTLTCLQYNLPFYLQYLANWPEYCLMAECAGGQAMGYILGKVEGADSDWHGHVTAVTVAPEYR